MKRTSSSRVILVIAGVAFTVTVLVGLMFFAGFWRTGSSYQVSVYVGNARGIAEDSTVFEAGLPVGLVTGIARNGPDAILKLSIDAGPRPLPVDSRVQLGLRSLAGEADVLLTPGNSSQTIRNGGSLGLSQDSGYTEVDQILTALGGRSEGNLRRFIRGFGRGVAGEGQNLNQTLGGAAALITDSLPVTSTLGAQRVQVADLVQNFGNVMNAIGQRSQAVQQFATGALQTFQAVAARDQALRRMLVQLPAVADNFKRASDTIGAVTPHIAPVVNRLADAVHQLTPAIQLLTPASRSGLNVVNALGQASPGLARVLDGLVKLQPQAAAALPAVHATLCQLAPMVRYIQPYGPDIAAFFSNDGATSSPYGLVSHDLLAAAMVNPDQFVQGIQSQPVSQAVSTLLNAGIFTKAGATLGYDPAPGPGQIGNKTKGLGLVDPATFGKQYSYPHVTADCNK
jgi:phospholipid/cholesterol/gamma-HCH transport system substrate-binding protein